MGEGERQIPEAPGAIVYTQRSTFWVHEKPAEVRRKRRDAIQSFREMGKEESEEDDMLALAGLEGTEEEGTLDAYTLFLHPLEITGIRGISNKSWRNIMAPAPQPQTERPPAGLAAIAQLLTGSQPPVQIHPEMECKHCDHQAANHASLVGPCQAGECPCDHFCPKPEDVENQRGET